MTKYFEKIRERIASLFLLTSLLFLATGCHQDQVQVYQVAGDKDQPAQSAVPATNLSNTSLPPGHPDVSTLPNSPGQMPAGMVSPDTQNAPSLTWTTPAGWTQVPPSAMRVASFKITGVDGKTADVSIVPLSGMGGGDVANVNRWRGQVGLSPAPVDALQNSAQAIEAGGQPAQIYDLGGASSRILGVIQHRDATAWFYKMTGDPDLVEQQKPAFIAFLQSLNFPSQQAQSPLPPGHPDIASQPVAAADPTAPISHDGQPSWQVPPGWQEVSGGQFLVAKFLLPGTGDSHAAVNVSHSAGGGGGLLANVNRWRGQLGLPPVTDIDGMPLALANGSAVIVDFTGDNVQTSRPTRLIGVQVTQAGQTWYYKLMGDPDVVAAQKDAFVKFVKGVNY